MIVIIIIIVITITVTITSTICQMLVTMMEANYPPKPDGLTNTMGSTTIGALNPKP